MVRYFEGDLDAARPTTRWSPPCTGSSTHADERAPAARCAPTPTPARTPPGPGASAPQGIGLCRTEHMFLGDRRELVERLILADDRRRARAPRWPRCCRCSGPTSSSIFRAMDGLPVTVRLIDPPLHEFLPPLEELAVHGRAWPRSAARTPGSDEALLAAVRRMHEQNPMLGLRGVRLGLVIPGLFAMQVRAIAEAAAALCRARAATRGRRSWCRWSARCRSWRRSAPRPSRSSPRWSATPASRCLIGTMIEVPRAALTAGQIAEAAEFFSFGTNDLTQMGWGFSRDDVEGAFFCRYLELGIFGVSPFESIDRDGVGRLVRIAVEEGRAARPDLKIGVCGEHGGDPESVHFFHEVGPGLRVLLAVPGAGGPAGGRPRGALSCGPLGRAPSTSHSDVKVPFLSVVRVYRWWQTGIRQRTLSALCPHRQEAAMGLRWHGTAVDAGDPARLARWWAEVLHFQILEERPDAVAIAPDQATYPGMLFVQAPAAKVGRNRLQVELGLRRPRR